MMRVVQLAHANAEPRVALVDEPFLRPLADRGSLESVAYWAIETGHSLRETIESRLSRETINYDDVYAGRSQWRLLPAFNHFIQHACLVSGTGLTHRASAENRANMHGAAAKPDALTDSMKMYRAGVEGGRPAPDAVGAQPEWFYKGNGFVLRAHGQPLDRPGFALDGGEEAEIAGCYVIGSDGTPFRVGFVQGNEFSDHVGEARNYLYLAESKLRTCSIGPELVVSPDEQFFAGEIRGRTMIQRAGRTIWQADLASGERWMCHTLANLEHHHFKNAFHRRPGDAHIHFLGADAFSFRDAVRLEDGDEMVVSFEGFGRALRNPIRIDRTPERVLSVKSL